MCLQFLTRRTKIWLMYFVFMLKKAGNDIEARHILEDLKTNVGIKGIEKFKNY